jgi:hypothetical protein
MPLKPLLKELIMKQRKDKAMDVKRYQFDSIVGKTKNTIDPIRRGEEDGYFGHLAILEIMIHRFCVTYGINGRQAMEILRIVLFDIKSLTESEEYDCSRWYEDNYQKCIDEIEKCFMPSKNPVLKDLLIKPESADGNYFELARMIIVRIHESVEQWTKDFGSDGYYNFISGFIGTEIVTSEQYLAEPHYFK